MDDTTPTAGEESWDDVTGGTDHVSGATGDDTFLYTNSSLMDDLTIKVAYIPSDAGTATAVSASINSSVDYTVSYTGIENLTIQAGAGENNNAGSASSYDMTVLNATYTYDAISVGWSVNEADSNGANEDRTLTAFGVSYAVNDDISVSLNSSETEVEGGTDQEAFGISASMVVGSMTISANHNSIENTGGTAGDDRSGYNLNLAFAF
jgi:outer membrane protein OmpU